MRAIAGRLTAVCVVLGACAALAAPASATTGNLVYQGGPVMASSTNVLVFWGSSVNSTYQSTDQSFFSDLAADSGLTTNVFAMLPEYSGSGHPITYNMPYAGAYTIAPTTTTCDGSSSTVCNVDNNQIGPELASQIAAGHLPAAAGNGMTTLYTIVFPPNVTISLNGTYSGNAAGGQFCSFHYSYAASASVNLLYAVLPDDFASGGCGPASAAVDNETSNISHQMSEAITDPLIGFSNPAWYDNSNGEIGDICVSGTDEATNRINGHTYTIQKEWSNNRAACVSTSTFTAPTGDFSAAPSGNSASFGSFGAGTANGDHTISSYTWDFGDGTGGSGASTSHAYGAGGSYPVTLTITDNLGFIKRVTHSVTVSAPPSSTQTNNGNGNGNGGSGTGGNTQPASVSDNGPVASAAAGGAIVVNDGQTVACPQGASACAVSVVATVPSGSAAKRKAKKKQPVVVGQASFTVSPGHATRVSFSLNATGKRMLNRLHHLSVIVSVTVRHGNDAPVTSTKHITVRPPAKAKRHH